MNRIVLITGGTAGIGLALAEAFIREGDRVVVCGRSQDALDRFSSAHPEHMAFQADMTDTAARAAMLDAVQAAYTRLDILINNAGTFVEREIAGAPDSLDGLEQEVALNLTAPIQLTDEVLRRWPGVSALVFVTSGFALVSPARAPTYGAVKAGLHGFADGLRHQLAARGIHVLELLPPATDTQMNANLNVKKLSKAEVAETTLEALSRRRPMALPGSTKWLPVLLRLAPTKIRKMVARM